MAFRIAHFNREKHVFSLGNTHRFWKRAALRPSFLRSLLFFLRRRGTLPAIPVWLAYRWLVGTSWSKRTNHDRHSVSLEGLSRHEDIIRVWLRNRIRATRDGWRDIGDGREQSLATFWHLPKMLEPDAFLWFVGTFSRELRTLDHRIKRMWRRHSKTPGLAGCFWMGTPLYCENSHDGSSFLFSLFLSSASSVWAPPIGFSVDNQRRMRLLLAKHFPDTLSEILFHDVRAHEQGRMFLQSIVPKLASEHTESLVRQGEQRLLRMEYSLEKMFEESFSEQHFMPLLAIRLEAQEAQSDLSPFLRRALERHRLTKLVLNEARSAKSGQQKNKRRM